MLSELKYEQKDPIKILYDSDKDLFFHGRSKHISIKFHYIKELVKNQEIELEFCRSKDQIADIFTKPLKTNVLEKLKMMFSMIDFITQIKVGCRNYNMS